tara:strand:+ start:94568 stop:94756 length:189 start_codon:yes stop_codon:yes gene_type:complete
LTQILEALQFVSVSKQQWRLVEEFQSQSSNSSVAADPMENAPPLLPSLIRFAIELPTAQMIL